MSEQGRYGTLKPRTIYTNVNGSKYKCLHSAPGDSIKGVVPRADMVQIQTGWRFTAVGTRVHTDGRISWDWSTGGRYPGEI